MKLEGYATQFGILYHRQRCWKLSVGEIRYHIGKWLLFSLWIPNVWKKKIVGNEILTSYNCSESEFRSAEFHFITTWTKYHRFLHGIQNIDKVSFFQPIFCVSIHVLKRWRSLLKYCKSQNEFGNRFRFFFIIFQFLAI